MTPRLAAAASELSKPPVRMAVLYMPNGVHPDMWTPEGEGRDFQLSPTLEPLADFKKASSSDEPRPQGVPYRRRTLRQDRGLPDRDHDHKTVGVDLNCNGVSMDQVAAKAVGHLTPLPSLELGTEPVRTGVDSRRVHARL
jgi:hypothetical protein